MSWLSRTIASTLGGANTSDDAGEPEKEPTTPSHNRDSTESEPHHPETPTRGVKGDLSELTRRLWGVASFLAPPPQQGSSSSAAEDESEGYGEEEEEEAGTPRGIDRDLAEISAKVRSGISMLSNTKAVAEIGKLASSLFRGDEEEEEEAEEEAGERMGLIGDVSAVGVTEEVLVFVRHIAMRPETWLDFPALNDDGYGDFALSDAQLEHASVIESLVPLLAGLREELCPSYMTQGCFWKIYFVLLHSKLSNHDAEILSTPQIMEARTKLQLAQPRSKPESGIDATSWKDEEEIRNTAEDEKVISTSAIEREAIQPKDSHLQGANFSAPQVAETEKHPVQTTEVEVVDKAVIEEVVPVKLVPVPVAAKQTIQEKQPIQEDDEVEEWLEEDTGDVPVNSTSFAASAEDEEDVSFSDLEDDDQDGTKPSK